MLTATKVRIYPTDEQAAFLNAQFGAVRWAYNKALHIKKHWYQRHGVSLKPKHDLKPLLAVAKKSRKYGWLTDYDSMALQQAVINLDKAFVNYFNQRTKRGKDGRGGKPRFKSKHGPQSSYHCTCLSVTADSIKIPKLTPIKAHIHRDITGRVTSITIRRNAAGKYFAAILCDDGITAPEKPTVITAVTGVDMGLTHYLIQSNGTKTDNPRHLINASRNLRRKQKALSRKKKGSANRRKARLQLANLHERVANARADFQHKLTRRLVDENQALIAETLNVANMMKNRHLARVIADAGWAGFIAKLAYKAERKGVHFVKVSQWYASTKTCHCCDHKLADLPLSQRYWQCPSCLSQHDRDINAANATRNQGIVHLKAAGLVVTAHGGQRKSVTSTVAA